MIEKFLDMFKTETRTTRSLEKNLNKLAEYFMDKHDTEYFATRRLVIRNVNQHINLCDQLEEDISEEINELKKQGKLPYITKDGYKGGKSDDR